MNKQRKVLITITYNEMGIIIDTKAEEVAQPNLQPTCDQLATDCISRQAVKEWLDRWEGYIDKDVIARMKYRTIDIPPAQPELEDKIRAIGYTGKEGRIYIGGRLFAVRELPQ